MRLNTYVRHTIIALAGIVVGLMSVSLIYDLAIYNAPKSPEVEQLATQYYFIVRTSFVPYIVVGTLLGLVVTAIYRVIYDRNWRTILIALGIFALSIYYVTVVFGLEDNLPNLTDFQARIDSLLQIGLAHLLTWLAGWLAIFLLVPETDNRE